MSTIESRSFLYSALFARIECEALEPLALEILWKRTRGSPTMTLGPFFCESFFFRADTVAWYPKKLSRFSNWPWSSWISSGETDWNTGCQLNEAGLSLFAVNLCGRFWCDDNYFCDEAFVVVLFFGLLAVVCRLNTIFAGCN